MSISKKAISFLFIIFGSILTVLFAIQLSEIFTKDSRFLFFQILFVVVWGTGALIFWIIGLSVLRSGRVKKEDDI